MRAFDFSKKNFWNFSKCQKFKKKCKKNLMFESGRAGDQTHGRQDLPIYSPVTYPLDHRAFDKDTMFFQLCICNIHILIYNNVYTLSLSLTLFLSFFLSFFLFSLSFLSLVSFYEISSEFCFFLSLTPFFFSFSLFFRPLFSLFFIFI